jgi:hypothetical protein
VIKRAAIAGRPKVVLLLLQTQKNTTVGKGSKKTFSRSAGIQTNNRYSALFS